MTPQEQAPDSKRTPRELQVLENDFQRVCEEAALRILCDHRDAWIETQERKEESA